MMKIEKKHVELALIGVFLLIFVYIIMGFLNRPDARDQKRASIKADQPAAQAGLKPEGAAFAKKSLNVKPASWGRDPFVLGEAPQGEHAGAANLLLKGIVMEGTKPPKAIINDEILTVGSTIQGYKVTHIARDKVVVTDGNKDFEISIQNE